MRILTVVGARPQFIKAAVVSRAVEAWNQTHGGGLEELIVHTGQHYDAQMSDVFFDEMRIPQPAAHLGIGGLSHGAMTGRMLEAIEQTILRERPDVVLVYGDTNSTLAGALAAAKLLVPVAHVEAGLRSFNRRMPEEVNRVLADQISEVLFAPTRTAVANLLRESIPAERIHQIGDVMFDASLFYAAIARERSGVMARLGLARGGYVLATTHRQENTDDPERMAAVFGGLAAIARDTRVVLPLHPRTRESLAGNAAAAAAAKALDLIDPVGYLDMVMLEENAAVIATDSGGVQKEAYFYGVPCVTLRDETEWVELVEIGVNRLAPPSSAEVVSGAIAQALSDRRSLRKEQLYGAGDAGAKIVQVLAARRGA